MYVFTDKELNEILASEGFRGDIANERTIEICDIDENWELEGAYYD